MELIADPAVLMYLLEGLPGFHHTVFYFYSDNHLFLTGFSWIKGLLLKKECGGDVDDLQLTTVHKKELKGEGRSN